MKVHKRNGVIEDFDVKCIEKSIQAAFAETLHAPGDLPSKVATEVEPEIMKADEMISSIQIGDIVGKVLMKEAPFEVLRSYILRSVLL